MENESGRPFPHGSVLKKFEGTIYQLGDMQFRPTKIICEELGVSGIARRDAIFDAENVDTGESVVLKLGAETDPTVYCDPSSIDMYRSRGLSTFQEEAHMFQQGSSSGYTPDCIEYAEFQQDDRYEYPGGYLCVLVLSKNPIHTKDFRLAVIRHELTGSELQLALRHCEEMFRAFRARGLSLGINALELEYNPETKKPYVRHPERFAKVKPEQPPLSDLYEMGDIEYMIQGWFGDEARDEIFGDVSWQTTK